LVKRIALILLFIFLCLPAIGRAQESPTLSTMEIDLWPEYDRPSMLVIYKAALSPQVALPAELTFRIPVASGKPAAVAVGPDSASVADVVYDTRVNGDWVEVSFIATMPAVQFEYYDPNLKIDGAQRSFQYEWPGDYAMDSLDLQIQHPVGATDFVVSPTAGKVVQGKDGFAYNFIEVGALPVGSPFSLDVSYQKASDDLSVASLQVEPSAPISPGTSGRVNLLEWWPWILGGLGVLLIAGGGFWYWRSGRGEATTEGRRRRRSARVKIEDTPPQEGVYCHQCGKRAGPGDRFCRSCGTRLRVE
jgi:hypothetical protein